MSEPRQPKRLYVAALLLLAGVVWSVCGLSWELSAIESGEAISNSWARFAKFLTSFGEPDLSAETLATVGWLMLDTLGVAVLGVALGLVLAYPIALSACRAVVLGDDLHTAPSRWLRRAWLEANRFLLDVMRGVPDFAWALVLANFTGIGTPTGVIAIGISVAGILGKVLSEQWDNVDPLRYTALRSTGAGRLQTFLYGIQPLSARAMLSFVLMRTECAIRNASVIGVIAGGGLGSGLWDAFADGSYGVVVTRLAAMLLLTASADLTANLLRYQLRVDPNHPRSRRGQSCRSSTTQRAFGVLICFLLVGGAAAFLSPALANLLVELQHVERDFAFGFTRRLLWSPDLGATGVAIRESFVPLAAALLTTSAATALAALLAYPASVAFQLQAQNFTGELPSRARVALRSCSLIATRGLGLVCRGVPEVAWVLILGAFFRQGLLAGVLAVTVHSAGVLLRVFAETIDNVPFRRLEQISGACRPQIFVYGALPSAWPDWKTYAGFQFEVNMRMGIVLGMVGAGGLGDAFKTNLGYFQLERAGAFLWAMILLTVLTDRVSRWLQMRRLKC
jgi:phosphonate transport system permease protein